MESWERNSKPSFNTKVVETPKSSCEAFGSPSIFNLVPSEEKLVSVGLYNKFDYVTRKETQQVGFMLLPWGKKEKQLREVSSDYSAAVLFIYLFFLLCVKCIYTPLWVTLIQAVDFTSDNMTVHVVQAVQREYSSSLDADEAVEKNIWFVSTQLFDCMWESSSRLWGVSTLKQRFGSKRRQLWRTETKMFFITSNKT